MSALYGARALGVAEARLGIYAPGGGGDLDGELAETAQLVTARYPRIGEYDGFSEGDQYWFDTAVGVLTAIRVVWQLVTQTNQGASRWKVDDVEYWLTDVPTPEVQAQWQKEALEALNLVSVMRAVLSVAAASFSMFQLAGRTRTLEQCCAIDITPLLPVGWGLLTGSPWAADGSGAALVDQTTDTFYN